MEGHRRLTQYVQPMDLKGFLIQNFQHLLNVIKQLGLLKHSTEMSQIQFSVLAKYVDLGRVICLSKQQYCFPTHVRWFSPFQTMWRGFCMASQTPGNISRDMLIWCFPIAWDQSIPESLRGVDYNGILAWCYCPSVPTEYNHMNQGWMAEQSTAEEMKDAWVVVAIVHLIRTEVSIQSNPRSLTN